MSYEMYRYIFLGGLVACGVFFVVAVVLFFTLRIPKVISDLTGRTAKKAIENIRQQNEQSGDKTYKSSAVNLQRGKLTDRITQSGRLVPRNTTPFGTGVITEKISTQELDDSDKADARNGAEETYGANTTAGETDALAPPAGETEVLAVTEQPAQTFSVEFEITFIHTVEVID